MSSYIPAVRPSACPNPTLRLLVREPAAHAYPHERLAPDDLRARRLARDAADWLRFAEERARMRPDAVLTKGLDALAFSVQHRARSLAVPTKLARLALFDVLSREVALVVDAEREGWPHAATLDTSRLAAGVYVVRLVAGGRCLRGG